MAGENIKPEIRFETKKIMASDPGKQSGVPVLRMYEYERIRGVVYQMDFWLEEDSRLLNCRMRIVNECADVIPMYWWSNIAAPEFEDGRIVVPARKAYTNRGGEEYRMYEDIAGGEPRHGDKLQQFPINDTVKMRAVSADFLESEKS